MRSFRDLPRVPARINHHDLARRVIAGAERPTHGRIPAAGALRARLHRDGTDADVKTWIESAPFYVAVRRLYAAIFLFTGLVLATG